MKNPTDKRTPHSTNTPPKSTHFPTTMMILLSNMIKEIRAKTILRRHKKIDSWFMTHYGLNLYRGCLHDCTYCDGRAETYQIEGEFGKDIEVKTNAIARKNINIEYHIIYPYLRVI